MRKVLLVMTLLALLGGPVSAQTERRPIHRYAFWNAHREDAGDLSGWTSVYTFTHETCGSAVMATLTMAYRDGWDTETIDPPFDAIVHAFPVVLPCSATLALR